MCDSMRSESVMSWFFVFKYLSLKTLIFGQDSELGHRISSTVVAVKVVTFQSSFVRGDAARDNKIIRGRPDPVG
jgi:hypothetical protein